MSLFLLTCPVGVETIYNRGVAACSTTIPGTCEFSVCTHIGVLSGKEDKARSHTVLIVVVFLLH